MNERGITTCDLLKMNCEGSEFRILLSSPAAVLCRIRTMLVLYHCDLAQNSSVESLVAHLENCGFKITIRNRTAVRGWLIAEGSQAQR